MSAAIIPFRPYREKAFRNPSFALERTDWVVRAFLTDYLGPSTVYKLSGRQVISVKTGEIQYLPKSQT